MRVQNIKVKITIPIPIDRPDKNGVVFTRSAIENAINKFPTHSPIIFKDNDKCIDSICVGSTLGSPGAEWDDETQTCKMSGRFFLFIPQNGSFCL